MFHACEAEDAKCLPKVSFHIIHIIIHTRGEAATRRLNHVACPDCGLSRRLDSLENEIRRHIYVYPEGPRGVRHH